MDFLNPQRLEAVDCAATLDFTSTDFNDPVSCFFKDIGPLKSLSAAEEQALFLRLQQGDTTVRDVIVVHNLKFLSIFTRPEWYDRFPLADQLAEGTLGLYRAVDKFEVSRGLRFTTYAKFHVQEAIKQAYHQMAHTIRLPGNAWAAYAKGITPESSHEARLEHESLSALMNPYIELDSPLDNDTTLQEVLPSLERRPEEWLELAQQETALHALLDILTEKERAIVEHRYGFHDDVPLTFPEIKERLNLDCTRQTVQNIFNNAMARLTAVAPSFNII